MPNPDRFEPFGASHLVALAILVVGAVLVVVIGRRRRDQDPTDRTGKALAVGILIATIPLQALYFTPAHWNPYAALPIQLCDLASIAAMIALWTHRWWAVALTYFWGLFLTTQAIATPDLRPDFPDPDFILFWTMHISTVWAALYLTFARRVVPDWRSYRFVVGLTLSWAAALFCLNVVLDSNYGYLNGKPEAPTVLDYLGPWPIFVFVEIAIICGVWALATVPWTRGSRPSDVEERHRSAARQT